VFGHMMSFAEFCGKVSGFDVKLAHCVQARHCCRRYRWTHLTYWSGILLGN